MEHYEKVYDAPYTDGWKDSPSKETPIEAEILNQYDNAFIHIENFLESLNLSKYATKEFVDNAVRAAIVTILEGAS